MQQYDVRCIIVRGKGFDDIPMDEIRIGDRVKMRKTHPCGSDEWKVIRIGADIKIKCIGCGRIVMMQRADFIKRRKAILELGPVSEADSLMEIARAYQENEMNREENLQ